MNGRRLAVSMVLLAGMAAAGPAAAERLVLSLSHHRVLVTSSFTGTEVVLFGSIERDATAPAPRRGYDVVVTVSGPHESERTRRKGRVLGIWVNVESRTFVDVPNYLAVLANKPLDAIATSDLQRRLQIGVANTVLRQRIDSTVVEAPPDDPFRAAFLRLKKEHGLYIERDNAVTFFTPTLFRADIPLPSNVPFGLYDVDVKVFADGAMITEATSALEIIKVGFEQFVADAARDHGLAYGVATAMLALLTGWFASVVFRRD